MNEDDIKKFWDIQEKRLMRLKKKDIIKITIQYQLLFFGSALYDSMKPMVELSKKTNEVLKE